MSPDNLQRFIEQHPKFIVAIFPVYFIMLWLGMGAIISYLGGWFSLSKFYRSRVPFSGGKWGMQSGQMRWWMYYNNVLTIGVNREGLYLAAMFLFRFMHPPLLIPWSEIKARKSKGWFFEYVTFTMGRELAIPLRIHVKVAAKLRDAARDCWPIEEM